MASDKFRIELRQEAQEWLKQGLIDREFYDALADRYQFSQIEAAQGDRFVMTLLGLGSILLGLAIITFVAANWQAWPNTAKLILLSALFLGINIAGFLLYRTGNGGVKSRLGKGLLLLGAFVFGANLTFMAQIFHTSGQLYTLYLIWAFGVLLMSLGLELGFLGIISLTLTIFAYISGLSSIFSQWEFSFFALFLEHIPLIILVIFIPLAYWCKSPWLFGLSVVFLIIAYPVNLLTIAADFYNFYPWLGAIIVASAYALLPAFLWSYDETNLPLANRDELYFNNITKTLAILILSILFFICSFNSLWEKVLNTGVSQPSFNKWLIFIDIIFLVLITLWNWWKAARSNRLNFTSKGFGLMCSLCGIIFMIHIAITPLGGIATFIFNILLLVLAIALVKTGLDNGIRSSFWFAIILIVLQLSARMLEYNTGLLFKAVVLFLCGVGVIAAGLWFERYLRNFNTQP